MNVYVVTSGEYSDYGIDSIFSTQEKAQEYVDMRKFTDDCNENYNIKVWSVDEVYSNEVTDLIFINNKVYKLYDIKWEYDWIYYSEDNGNTIGNVTELNKCDIDEDFQNTEDLNQFRDEELKFPIYIVRGVTYNKDRSVMKKVVYDSIAKYKAEKEGL